MITIKYRTEYRPKLHTMYLPDDVGTSYDVDWIRPEQAERQQDAQASPASVSDRASQKTR